ncbi:hypothetical protein [Bdellovibrio sp. HCB274]|uniref:hypothetical protein n=1 Tax=Bdellovibrio sp. HCB274 TaxID=3394361 RepID=UPI0039B4F1A4
MKISKLLATAVLMSLAACAVKDDKASKVSLHNNDSTPKGEASVNAKAGGQPGQIMITGAAVQFDQDSGKTTLKSSLKSAVAAGTSADGKVAQVADENLPMLNLSKTESALKQVESDTSYAVLGCSDDQVEASYTNGLTLKKEAAANDLSSATTAKVVFICGELKSSTLALVIKADTLILNNANITSTAQAGVVDIGTNKLVLIGESKIETIGQDAAANVVPAASIEFNVTREVSGDGTLAILSRGGNVKKDAAPAEIGTSDQQKAKDAQEEQQDLAGRMALDTTR